MKYKLVLSDYDETLFPNDTKVISQHTKDVIKEYQKRGGVFVVASGRPFTAVKLVMQNLGLHGYLMAFNGSYVYDLDTNRELLNCNIDNKEAIKVCMQMEKEGLIAQIYNNGTVYYPYETESSKAYTLKTGVKMVYTNKKPSEFLIETKMDSDKLLVYTDPEKTNRDELVKHYTELFGDTSTFVFTQIDLFECINKNAGKGTAAKVIAEDMGISREEVMAFGDGQNDIEMIKYAGMGVAVDNAIDEVKKVADYIAPNCREDGVAKTIEKMCFGD